MALSRKKNLAAIASKKASKALKMRAKSDMLVLEMSRKYESSLEMAAKKCLEAIKHIESVAFGHKQIPHMLQEAKKAASLTIHLIVRASLTDQRKKAYVTKKDRAACESLISQRKKLEDDNFLNYNTADDSLDADRQPAAG